MANLFKPAKKSQAYLKCALAGPPGSGKTLSALLLASGLGEKICVIDTERGSSQLYEKQVSFNVAELNAPFSPSKYTLLIQSAIETGAEVLIIDSLSHIWFGSGGVLEMHQNATLNSPTKNSYFAWKEITPELNKVINLIIQSPLHVICTMRSKMAYEQVESGNKKNIVKLGLNPIMRDGIEYEFTIFWDLDADNFATTKKSRLLEKTGQISQIWPTSRREILTKAHGLELKNWLIS